MIVLIFSLLWQAIFAPVKDTIFSFVENFVLLWNCFNFNIMNESTCNSYFYNETQWLKWFAFYSGHLLINCINLNNHTFSELLWVLLLINNQVIVFIWVYLWTSSLIHKHSLLTRRFPQTPSGNLCDNNSGWAHLYLWYKILD